MKYYAVKNGREPGIYNSWAECQKQIHGFKNASYKSFTSRKEAEEFISDKKEMPQMEHGLIAYVDGSPLSLSSILNGCLSDVTDDFPIDSHQEIRC